MIIDEYTRERLALNVARKLGGKMRDELLNREQIDNLRKTRVLLEQWRRHYNTRRPHGSLGYRPPAPEAKTPAIMPLAVAETR